MMNVTPESKEEIRQHTDFEAADLAKDVNECPVAYHHGDAPDCGARSQRLDACLRSDITSHKIRASQADTRRIDRRFKQEYDALRATLIGAGVPAMPAAEDAMEFLSKLDMVRHGEMFSFLTNRARLGEDFSRMSQ
jgi:hypothetical protein